MVMASATVTRRLTFAGLASPARASRWRTLTICIKAIVIVRNRRAKRLNSAAQRLVILHTYLDSGFASEPHSESQLNGTRPTDLVQRVEAPAASICPQVRR